MMTHKAFSFLNGFSSFHFFSSGCSSWLIDEGQGDNCGLHGWLLSRNYYGDGFEDGYGEGDGDGDGRGETGYMQGDGWGSGESGFDGDGESEEDYLSLEFSVEE
jgi:hypothetical protein